MAFKFYQAVIDLAQRGFPSLDDTSVITVSALDRAKLARVPAQFPSHVTILHNEPNIYDELVGRPEDRVVEPGKKLYSGRLFNDVFDFRVVKSPALTISPLLWSRADYVKPMPENFPRPRTLLWLALSSIYKHHTEQVIHGTHKVPQCSSS